MSQECYSVDVCSRLVRWKGRAGRERSLLGRRGTTSSADARISIDVRVRCREAVCKCLHESDDEVFLRVRQVELTYGHVDVFRHLRCRPAVYFFSRSRRAVSHGHGEWVNIARVVEMNELLQALDIAVVEEFLLEIRPRRLGGGALCG